MSQTISRIILIECSLNIIHLFLPLNSFTGITETNIEELRLLNLVLARTKQKLAAQIRAAKHQTVALYNDLKQRFSGESVQFCTESNK